MKTKLFTRNFTFLILGQISSLFGNYTLRFAMSMYVLEQTGSASIFAGLLALSMLPTILLSPLGGILADRANRRNIMVFLDIGSGIAVLIGCAVFWGGYDLVGIGLLLILLSVLGAFESPTVQACIPAMLSEENIVKGNAAVNQVSAIASLVTPFLGSVLYTTFGILPIFYGAMACFFLTAGFECFIRLDFRNPDDRTGVWTIIREDFKVSMRFLGKEQTGILKLLLLAAVVSLFVAGTLVVGFPYLVRTVLGLSERDGSSRDSGRRDRGCMGEKNPVTGYVRHLLCVWYLPDSKRGCVPASYREHGTLRRPADLFLHMSVRLQHLFYLCDFCDSGAHSGILDGQGHVLCFHAIDVRAASGADDLRRAL